MNFSSITLRLFLAVAAIFMTASSVYSDYRLVNAFPNLAFDKPLFFTVSPDASNLDFVVEQTGKIVVFQNDSNASSATTFLDVTSKIVSGGEQGLLGLAFHPGYRFNRYFYIYYTKAGTGELILARYTRSVNDPLTADSSSGLILLTIAHPDFTNHNGGCLMFAQDGYLYVCVGDGGSSGDPNNNAQNTNALLGKILRIDVNSTSGGNNYGIPPSNPFAAGGGKPEIYCYGVRNPWRICQDPVTGIIYAGDVGQNIYEEIDIITAGGNYGWRVMEGLHCYNPVSGCDTSGLIKPIKEYQHLGLSCSITGGYVYRGSRMPELVGSYIYGDYCSTNIWSLKYENGTVTNDILLKATALPPVSLSSFGIDRTYELYVCKLVPPGAVYRLVNDQGGNEGNSVINGYSLNQNYPNPFNPGTDIKYITPKYSFVSLYVYDARGREISKLVNENVPPGEHVVKWDGANYSSGIYFYSISAGEFSYSRKMVLVK